MAPSFSGVWKLQTKYQYNSAFPVDINLLPRSLIAGGNVASGSADASAGSNQVQMLQISNTANATDYGDLTVARTRVAGGGSDTRFVTAGGEGTGGGSDKKDIIDYKLYASSGNLSDFGDLVDGRDDINSIGNNNVRLIFSGGGTSSGYHNVMQYITIASTGNTTDFGDLSVASSAGQTGIVGTTTRGISAIGINSSYTVLNTIEYVTIASTGNSTDFGDRTNSVIHATGCASSTRGVFMGGNTDGTADDNVNVIDYITMGSTGNATDFGDLSQSTFRAGGISNTTKGLYLGGSTNAGATTVNTIDQITIGSTGNATDFADLATATSGHSAASAEFPSVQNESYFTPAAMSLIHHGTLVGGTGQTGVSYIDIATTGSLAMFGDVSGPSSYVISGGAASTTRGVLAGIHTASGSLGDDLEFFTFSTKGKSTDFGDATQILYGSMGSNDTRGVMQVGYNGSTYTINTIEYITIASAGDTTDFGDLTEGGSRSAPAGSTTRLLFMGRDAYGTGTQNGSTTVDYVTIASTGNATDFGDLSTAVHYAAGVSSNTRAVKCGGWSNSNTTAVNEMDYFTIASTGNATDFGDLTVARGGMVGCSSKIRGVLGTGANATGGTTDVLDYITIASTGNATDWGDWYATHSLNRFAVGSASNSHGGLS